MCVSVECGARGDEFVEPPGQVVCARTERDREPLRVGVGTGGVSPRTGERLRKHVRRLHCRRASRRGEVRRDPLSPFVARARVRFSQRGEAHARLILRLAKRVKGKRDASFLSASPKSLVEYVGRRQTRSSAPAFLKCVTQRVLSKDSAPLLFAGPYLPRQVVESLARGRETLSPARCTACAVEAV